MAITLILGLLFLVVGFAAGGAAYGPALTDIVILGPAGLWFYETWLSKAALGAPCTDAVSRCTPLSQPPTPWKFPVESDTRAVW